MLLYFTSSISDCLVAFWQLFLNEYECINEWLISITSYVTTPSLRSKYAFLRCV